MKFSRILLSVITITTLFFSSIANATLYQFDITGNYTAQWQLNSSTIPDDVTNGEAFIIWNVSGSFANASSHVVDIIFFNSLRGGGISIDDFNAGLNLLSSDGPQLYEGTEISPSFKLGTYALTEFHGSGTYTLTVKEAAPIPEPATSFMLLSGLTLIFLLKRSR